jgi:hypothetical protein
MAVENGCGPACPYWVDNLGELNDPACRYYATVCSAIEKCHPVKPLNEPERQIVKKPGIRPTSAWPGTSRGWGPITRKLEGE